MKPDEISDFVSHYSDLNICNSGHQDVVGFGVARDTFSNRQFVGRIRHGHDILLPSCRAPSEVFTSVLQFQGCHDMITRSAS